MKTIKIKCSECDVVTYSAIDNYNNEPYIRCSNCGWANCCNESNVVNIEETLDISNLINKVGD